LESAQGYGAAFAREKELIAERGTLSPGGYNATEGGEGVIGFEYSDDWKRDHSRRLRAYWDSPEGAAARERQAQVTRNTYDTKPELRAMAVQRLNENRHRGLDKRRAALRTPEYRARRSAIAKRIAAERFGFDRMTEEQRAAHREQLKERKKQRRAERWAALPPEQKETAMAAARQRARKWYAARREAASSRA
jgi:hypothetical protein